MSFFTLSSPVASVAAKEKAAKVVYDGAIYCSQRRGGISRYYTRIIEYMAQMRPDWRFEIHVNPRPTATLPRGDNIYVLVRPYLCPGKAWFPVNYLIREYCYRATRPSLYHSTLYRPFRFAPCPLITTIHDVVQLVLPQFYHSKAGRRLTRFQRWWARHADAILTDSEASRRDIVSLLGADPARVHVTYLGVDEAFRPASETEIQDVCRRYGLRRPYLVYVGHRGEHKNFAVVRLALQSQRLSAWQLVLVGGGPLAPCEIPAGVSGEMVKHIGECEDAELRLIYAGADALLFPSLYEGFGLPCLEAMACGTAVVASDIPVLREICGNDCEYFDHRDPEDLVRAIWRIADPTRRAELTAGGLRRAGRFSWDRCAAQTLEVYEQLLGSGEGCG